MKKIIGLLLLVAISLRAFAQATDSTKFQSLKEVPNIPTEATGLSDRQPEFNGGLHALASYLSQNKKYPEEAKEKNIKGHVYVQFMVETDGAITDIKVDTKANPILANEALRVVKSMPNWTPAIKSGEVVRTRVFLFLKFKPEGFVDKNDTIVCDNEYLTAQQVLSDTSKFFTSVEAPPEFRGGASGLNKFLEEHIKYPAKARKNNIQGRVVLTFIVDREGNVTNVDLKKEIGGGCGDEAIRVVKLMSKWRPGKVYGIPVKTMYVLPVTFKLQD